MAWRHLEEGITGQPKPVWWVLTTILVMAALSAPLVMPELHPKEVGGSLHLEIDVKRREIAPF